MRSKDGKRALIESVLIRLLQKAEHSSESGVSNKALKDSVLEMENAFEILMKEVLEDFVYVQEVFTKSEMKEMYEDLKKRFL